MNITPLEAACLEKCPHCREAKRRAESGRKGHTLRFRDDTKEWVHDFVDGSRFDHRFCYATELRKNHG